MSISDEQKEPRRGRTRQTRRFENITEKASSRAGEWQKRRTEENAMSYQEFL
jgi:hypothetical protein